MAFAASACASTFDSDVEDLGSTDVITQDLDTPPADEPFYTSPSEFAGRWIGIADDLFALGVAQGGTPPGYRFPSGSTSIVLDLEFIEDPSFFPDLHGTITFGAGEPPPPPTDPSVGYPVGLSYSDLYTYDSTEFGGSAFGDASPLPPLEGFVYSIQQTAFQDPTPSDRVPDGVLLLGYSTAEYLNPWCELQTPVPDGNGGYACIAPYDQIATEDGACFVGYADDSACPPDLEQLPIDQYFDVLEQCRQTRHEPMDCDKLFLCSGLAEAPDNGRCACDATGCFGNYLSAVYSDNAIMTLRRNGDELVGVITEGWFLNPRGLRTPLGTIRFQRAP